MLACAIGLGLMPATGSKATQHHRARMFTSPELDAALVVDARSGRVLYARNEAEARHPASLTKLMTLYLLFEQLRLHKVSLASELTVSEHAAAQPRSHIRLREGNTISVDMAIKAIAVASANDAAVAVAESIGGTEAHFAELMNAKARQLGMNHSFFHNATGLPDDAQLTTAGDLSLLARRLIRDFPEYFGYFRLKQMSWRGIDYFSHNALLSTCKGVDGMKTGYIDASGFNLVATAARSGRRLVAVVMGGVTAERRDDAMADLLETAFAMPLRPSVGLIEQVRLSPEVTSQLSGDSRASSSMLAGRPDDTD